MRSGSTLLCSMLRDTGVAGSPDSYFHTPDIDQWCRDLGVRRQGSMARHDTLRAVIAAARTKGRGCSAVFGFRLQQQSHRYLMQQLAVLAPDAPNDTPNDARRITAAFGRTLFIALSRRDTLAQAVSFVKAQKSGLWHKAPDGTEIERLSAPRPPVYDRTAIATQLTKFQRM